MANTKKMTCPDCGVEMNHHAEKLDYSESPDDAGAIDSDLGGVLQEIHTCPLCGRTHMRPAVQDE